MIQSLKANWILIVSMFFILANCYFIAEEQFWFALLPIALILGWALITSLNKLLLFIVFATPLSISLEDLDIGGIGFYIPTEPLMFGIMVLFFIKLGLDRRTVDRKLLKHPITIAIIIHLVWMAITCITSEHPIVSIKFLVSRLWFVITLYFIGVQLFTKTKNITLFLWLYVLGFAIVIIYTLINHSLYGFEQDPAHWVMSPFFKDHTSYGSLIAMYFPVVVGLMLNKAGSSVQRGIAFFMLLLFTAGLIFSYTRAAWVSLLGAFLVYLAMVLRVRTWMVVGVLIVGAGVLVANMNNIEMALEKNREESSDDLAEHVQSISNISSDASNLERINRWNSALRMWQDRPIFGFGPGTYMFEYAPYQHSSELTIISTNFGTGGNAHSEYLGPLSEQGVLGMLSMLFIIAMVIRTALRLYKRSKSGWPRILITTLFLGLITYWVHGILNNYLDTDKASVPFWGFAAVLVAIDLYHRKEFLKEDIAEDEKVELLNGAG